MPRKSTSSISAGDIAIPMPSNRGGSAVGSTQDGDTSMLSVPPDASATTTTTTTATNTTTTKPRVSGKPAKEEADSVGIDDLLLPRTLTSRLARGILPANTSIQKDAVLALTKAATVFISYLAHHANELTQKKTVGPQDVLKAIQEIEMAGVMGLGQVGPDGKPGGRLERELEVFETVVKGKRKGYRDKVKARESGASHSNDRRGVVDGDDGGEREAKRARFEEGGEGGLDSDQQATPGKAVTTTARMPRPPSVQVQHHPSAPTTSSPARPGINGRTPDHLPNDDAVAEGDAGDENGENEEDEEDEDGHSEEDEDDDQEGGEDEGEEEDEEEDRHPNEDDLDGYGPDDQLRLDMEAGNEDDDGSGDDSD